MCFGEERVLLLVELEGNFALAALAGMQIVAFIGRKFLSLPKPDSAIVLIVNLCSDVVGCYFLFIYFFFAAAIR